MEYPPINDRHLFSRRRVLQGIGLVVAGAVARNTVLGLVSGSSDTHPSANIREHEGTMPELEPIPYELDLLEDSQWGYLAGAMPTAEGLRIQKTGHAITNQDGSPNEENPPLNLFGTRLGVHGNFEVTAEVADRTGEAAITLHGRPPIVLDETRMEGPSVRIALDDDLWIGVWDGQKDTPAEEAVFDNLTSQERTRLTITRKNDNLQLAVGSKVVGTIPAHGIFESGQVWIGLDSPDGEWSLTDFRAGGLDGGSVEKIDTTQLHVEQRDPNGFQELARTHGHNLLVGAAVSLGPLVSDPAYLQKAASGYYGSWTTENALKEQFTHPLDGLTTFQEADALVTIAERHGITVHGHTLVFGEALPQRIREMAPDQLRTTMVQEITETVTYFKERHPGVIKSWDVVNEPIADYEQFMPGESELRATPYYRAMGEAYIDEAFRAARAADPEALLFMNDFGLEGSIGDEDTERWDAALALIDRLLARGVPIDGIGFQTHVYEEGDEVDADVFRSRIEQLKQRGLKFRVSEMDVYGHDSAKQAQEFAKVAAVCMEYPEDCAGFSMWGVGERYGSTSFVDDDGRYQIGDGLPFGANMEPLKAAQSLQSTLGR